MSRFFLICPRLERSRIRSFTASGLKDAFEQASIAFDIPLYALDCRASRVEVFSDKAVDKFKEGEVKLVSMTTVRLFRKAD